MSITRRAKKTLPVVGLPPSQLGSERRLPAPLSRDLVEPNRQAEGASGPVREVGPS